MYYVHPWYIVYSIYFDAVWYKLQDIYILYSSLSDDDYLLLVLFSSFLFHFQSLSIIFAFLLPILSFPYVWTHLNYHHYHHFHNRFSHTFILRRISLSNPPFFNFLSLLLLLFSTLKHFVPFFFLISIFIFIHHRLILNNDTKLSWNLFSTVFTMRLKCNLIFAKQNC